ncbi:MAG: hypothetical protein GY842_19780 [bacterium]|nr:hypothetical protein [bacterium]
MGEKYALGVGLEKLTALVVVDERHDRRTEIGFARWRWGEPAIAEDDSYTGSGELTFDDDRLKRILRSCEPVALEDEHV